MTQYVISLTASLGVLSLLWRRGDLPVCGCTVLCDDWECSGVRADCVSVAPVGDLFSQVSLNDMIAFIKDGGLVYLI